MSERGLSRGLLAAAVALLAASSWRALLGGAPEHSDHALHLAALLRMGDALARGERPLDHWFAGAAFGYPLFRVYPPLGHLLALALSLVSRAPLETALGWVRFACLCALPLSVDRGLRWAGLSRLAAAWGGALCLAPSSAFGFGLELGSFLPRGHGLFAQLVAMNACALALGAVLRAARSGERSSNGVAATLWLSLAVLAHPALALFTAAAALAGALASPGPLRPRLSTLLRIGLGVALLTAWYLVPALLDRAWICARAGSPRGSGPRSARARCSPGCSRDSCSTSGASRC